MKTHRTLLNQHSPKRGHTAAIGTEIADSPKCEKLNAALIALVQILGRQAAAEFLRTSAFSRTHEQGLAA